MTIYLESARRHAALCRNLMAARPVLARVGDGRRALAEALQLEMPDLMEAGDQRIATYREAASRWVEPAGGDRGS